MLKARIDRLKASVSITQLLSAYGYHVRPDLGDREQQFSCDLHGDGSDGKPSARVYPESDAFYCFGCGKQRDIIATVQDREGVSFTKAVFMLEKKYGLPAWDEDIPPKQSFEDEIESTFSSDENSFDRLSHSIRVLLDTLTSEREIPMKTMLSLWEAFDMASWHVERKKWSEDVGKEALHKVRIKALDASKRT